MTHFVSYLKTNDVHILRFISTKHKAIVSGLNPSSVRVIRRKQNKSTFVNYNFTLVKLNLQATLLIRVKNIEVIKNLSCCYFVYSRRIENESLRNHHSFEIGVGLIQNFERFTSKKIVQILSDPGSTMDGVHDAL